MRGLEDSLFEAMALFPERGDRVVVGDDDEAVGALLVELEEEVDDLAAGGGIEVAGRFVGEEEGGVVAEGAGDGDALLLAAGEFGGAMVLARSEADLVEEAGADGGIAAAGELGGELDVFEGGEFGEEVVGLEDEADGEVAPGGEGGAVPGVDRFAVPEDFAAVGALEAAEDLEEGAFAGAGRSLDGVESGGGEGGVEAAEDFEVGAGRGGRFCAGRRRRGWAEVLRRSRVSDLFRRD